LEPEGLGELRPAEHDTKRDAFPVPTTLLPSVVIMLPLSSQMTNRIGTFCNDPIKADWRPNGQPRSNKYRRHAPSSNAALGDARMAPFWLVP